MAGFDYLSFVPESCERGLCVICGLLPLSEYPSFLLVLGLTATLWWECMEIWLILLEGAGMEVVLALV